jgi:hypothetical protein
VLFNVWSKGGEEPWLLVHADVSGQAEATFPERMDVDNYSIIDRHHSHVISLAVLCNDQPAWRPFE